MDKQMLRIASKYYEGFTTHSLRAGKATQLIDDGKLLLAKKYLRHKNLDTTLGYHKSDTQQELELLTRLNQTSKAEEKPSIT